MNRLRQDGSMRRGFTLMEMVVVIFIIGILAAFAIAQYNKTTEKGRITDAYNLITAIKGCETRYLLKYNVFTGATSDLDILPPTTKFFGAPTVTANAGTAYTIEVTRSAPTNPNYGAYIVSYVGPGGTFLCNNTNCGQDLLP